MVDLIWSNRYFIALKETLSIKEIMMLRGIGQPKALSIRKKAIQYCIENGIDYEGKLVPTIAVFEVTGYSLDYYFMKMQMECEAIAIINRTGDD